MAIETPATPLEVDDGSTLSNESNAEGTVQSSDDSNAEAEASSTYNHQFKYGRRYHAYDLSLYMLPNDTTEQKRLNLQHQIFRMSIDGELNLAPVAKSPRVLDLGCGTGIWVIEFAKKHPDSTVIGIDLSPIQPPNLPGNCSFQVGNVEADWEGEAKYDLIHSRAMVGGIRSWPGLIKRAFENLKSCGYFELQDVAFPTYAVDPTQTDESKSIASGNGLYESGKVVGLDFKAPNKFYELLEAGGFVDVHTKWVNWPIGPWAKGDRYKAMGEMVLEDFTGAMEMTALLYKALGWSEEDTLTLIRDSVKEMKDQKVLLYQRVCFAYGKKPE